MGLDAVILILPYEGSVIIISLEIYSTWVGGCWVAKPRSNLRMKGRAGLERNFFQTSASRLKRGDNSKFSIQEFVFIDVKEMERQSLVIWSREKTYFLAFGICFFM